MNRKKAAAISAVLQYISLEQKNTDLKESKKNAYRKYLKESPSSWTIIGMTEAIKDRK